MNSSSRRLSPLLACAVLVFSLLPLRAHEPKNIIVMISDGASFGAWDIGSLVATGRRAATSVFGPEFRKYLHTTYPLNISTTPTLVSFPTVSYNAEKAWGIASYQDNLGYLHLQFTDSAAAGTAMATGVKTYNNAINWDNENRPIAATIPEIAKKTGRAVGTISSVPWSHATPAAYSNARNVNRNNYSEIANMMLDGGVMDVIMGAGHPQFSNDGQPRPGAEDFQYVGGEGTWTSLREGKHSQGWLLTDRLADFESLARGDLKPLGDSSRLLGVPRVATTLQQSRSGYEATDTPDSDPRVADVPTLATMALAGLNVLDDLGAGKGFFVQIEGGAVDWAAHGNQTARIAEEQRDFDQAVDAVIQWIEAHGGWEKNLLIVTTDHGNSMPSGPESDTVAHDRIEAEDIAAGQWTAERPQGVRWWATTHLNEAVPLFVRGAGAEKFEQFVTGTDPQFGKYFADWAAAGFDGRLVDNTAIFHVPASLLSPAPQAQRAP